MRNIPFWVSRVATAHISGMKKGVSEDTPSLSDRWNALAYAIAFTRLASRETLRDAVFLWITPLVTPRMISGCAA